MANQELNLAYSVEDFVRLCNIASGASNPNLLINWDFRNPVNQRRQTSYPGTYAIDMWSVGRGLAVNTGYVTPVVGYFGGFVERIERDLSEQIITVSFKMRKRTEDIVYVALLDSTTGNGFSSQSYILSDDFKIYSLTTTVPSNITKLSVTVFSANADTTRTCDVQCAKLEYGSVSTLANDGPADYAEELRKCQRYAFATSQQSLYRAAGISSSGGTIDFAIPVPVTMYATPTIVDTSKLSVRTLDATTQNGFTFTVNGRAENVIMIRAIKSSHGLSDAQLLVDANALFTANL